MKEEVVSIEVMENMALATNPFAVLNVTTRDDRERIMEAAEDRSLMIDAEKCQDARAVLTNPRRRIDAELAWFPGVSPSAASRVVSARTLDDLDELPLGGVAKINAYLAVGAVASPLGKDRLARLLDTVSTEADGISIDALLRDINEDREVAGFPPFNSTDAFDQALAERRQEWRRAVAGILTATPSLVMVEALYNLVDSMLAEERFPRLLHELIDDYSLRAQPFIKAELEAAQRAISKIRSLAASRPDALEPLIAALGKLLSTWEQITRPIQVSATLLGRTDEDSEGLAFAVRSVSIDLFNDHQLLEHSRRVLLLVASNFQAIPRVADKLAEDAAALDDIADQRQLREDEIAYAADIGTFNKSRLSVDTSGLSWKGEHYPLHSVAFARWGAISRSVNGIPTGTDYLIAWGDGRRTATVEFRNGKIFEAFTNRLWKAIGEHRLTAIIDTLRSGRTIRFGTAVIGNDTVVLKRKKMFGEEDAEFSWSEVSVVTRDGSFVINGPSGSKASSALSYRDVNNVHFLEVIVRKAFSAGRVRLSEAFGN
ncbi:hypothetical protein [Sphingobium sp. CFD-2]|uniref:hypothetical protein n=1 Tax=Sphingobium sp. CFD-2 TaxID=2878542 RepID=UPI00214B83B0|nr:hypothetical protein [Sphingobium sp. CFD-2]